MNKEKFKELALLFLMNELSKEEVIRFENVLLENDDFKKEFEEIKSFYAMLTAAKPAEAEESVLVEARYDLMRSIRNGRVEGPAHFSLSNILEGFLFRNYKFVFSATFTVVVGIFIGYLMFSKKEPQPQSYTASQDYNATQQNINNSSLKEIIAPAEKENSGEENKFDAVKPVERKEKTYQPVSGRILAASLLTENNPGLKLQALSKISEQSNKKGNKEDNKIKQALITALKTDPNPAVRKEAFNVLSKYSYDEQVQDAFLYTLSNDKNSGLRVMVIKALSELSFKGKALDERTKQVLSKKAETDNNGYVRIHAATMIKEVE